MRRQDASDKPTQPQLRKFCRVKPYHTVSDSHGNCLHIQWALSPSRSMSLSVAYSPDGQKRLSLFLVLTDL